MLQEEKLNLFFQFGCKLVAGWSGRLPGGSPPCQTEKRIKIADIGQCAVCYVQWTLDIWFYLKNYGGELDSIGNAIWGGQETKLGLVFK